MAKRLYDEGRKTRCNYDHANQLKWTTEQPSLAVPGQSHTIEEMLKRHASGIPMTYSQHLQYEDQYSEEPMPKFQDLTDIDHAKQKLADLKAQITKVKQNAQKAGEVALETPKKVNKTTEPATTSLKNEDNT